VTVIFPHFDFLALGGFTSLSAYFSKLPSKFELDLTAWKAVVLAADTMEACITIALLRIELRTKPYEGSVITVSP
jgi:hypothetical protein